MVAYQTYSDEDYEVRRARFLLFVSQQAAHAAHEKKAAFDAAQECPVETQEEQLT